MIDGKQSQKHFGIFTDSYNNKGYVKSVPAEKKLEGKYAGERIGTSLGSLNLLVDKVLGNI